MMLAEHDWYPPLDDLPEAGILLLSGIRVLIPGVVAHIRDGKIDQTPELGQDVDLGGTLGRTRFVMRGDSARSVLLGPREALSFGYRGRATIRGSSQAFSGTCAVDLATSALLELKLSTPVQV
jgi:hypothetical protein